MTVRTIRSLQFRLLGPIVALLLMIVAFIAFLYSSFDSQYTHLTNELAARSEIGQQTIDIIRSRARMQQLLYLYRITRDERYIPEIESSRNLRVVPLQRIASFSEGEPHMRHLGQSLIGGLSESTFLQHEVIQSTRAGNIDRANQAFARLTTIYDINSARLKDFSSMVGNEVAEDELQLRILFRKTFWLLACSVVGMAFATVFIALFYRRDLLIPLRRLHQGLQDLAKGNLSLKVEVLPRSREITEMTRDFNYMARALKSKQEELTVAREEALQAVRIKSDFLSNMSHEIRTPMNAILGMADELADSDLDELQKKYIDVLRNSGQVLLNVVNDILDYSRLEAGKIELETVDFDLLSVARRITEVIGVVSERKGLKVLFDFKPKDSIWVRGDPKRIEQILLNLLGNAVKFTERGQITLGIQAEPAEQSWLISIRVVDTGIGISPEALPRIFERFGQSDTSTTRRFGGTGLGLAIVKQLVEIMAGSINVTSVLGEGSEFEIVVQLPKGEARVSARSESQVGVESGSALSLAQRVLLVDDSADNRFLIDSYLKSTGIQLTMAENGQQAVDLFAEEKFDLVLMDMQMPVMDGLTATMRMREFERAQHRQRTRIVALSAYALPPEVDRSLKAGCDFHLSKPIRKADLLAAIQT